MLLVNLLTRFVIEDWQKELFMDYCQSDRDRIFSPDVTVLYALTVYPITHGLCL